MPVYEFRCSDCDETFTVPLTLKDFESKNYRCPSCEGKNLEEEFTSVNIVTSKKS